MAMESPVKECGNTAENNISKDAVEGKRVQDASSEELMYNSRVAKLRETEYPMLGDQIYLDHAATTIPSVSLLNEFAKDITSTLYGNPHSFGSASSQASSASCDNARLKVLRFFHADPAAFDVVFVANATAAIKLVADAMACQDDGFRYWYHRDAHTSLIGVRELARESTCLENDDAVEDWMAERALRSDEWNGSELFAYPAQSNMNGRRLPLSWCKKIGSPQRRIYTLLDAAALVSTSPLDLSHVELAPDFTTLSFYKIFGWPELGALIVKKNAGRIFRARKYFGGGTVETVACGKDQTWHLSKEGTLHESIEDGSLPIRSIRALELAIDNNERLFGGMEAVSRHTCFLARTLHAQLRALRHGNGLFVCKMHNETDSIVSNGPIIALNFLDALGSYVSLQEVQKLASIANIHLRTGNLCNPGGVSHALGLSAKDLMDNYSAGLRCGSDQDILNGRPTGVIRLSFGAMSTLADVEHFLEFVKSSFVEDIVIDRGDAMQLDKYSLPDFHVDSLVVYPIKSCGGYSIPRNVPWSIRRGGLAWDREWCLIHQGTRVALNQKRVPTLTLFKPILDLEKDSLHIEWVGSPSETATSSISVPLALDARLLRNSTTSSTTSCAKPGREGRNQPLIYTAPEITHFFSTHLGIPVYLARIPSKESLTSYDFRKKVHQEFEHYEYPHDMPGSFPTPPPSPPPFEVLEKPGTSVTNGSMANESPLLVLFLPSLARVNALLPTGADMISADNFRANIILGSRNPDEDESEPILPLQLVEDDLTMLRINNTRSENLNSSVRLSLTAPCRRCQMIAIDQDTALRKPKVYAHMAKVRRRKGGVWFGVHAVAETDDNGTTQDAGTTICVGDQISAS